MASLLSHAVAALGISACFYQSRVPNHVWILGTACSLVPDLDVLGFRFGIRYADFWGHRGFTHSLVFAALIAGVVVVFFRHGIAGLRPLILCIYFFLVTASHGFLDAMTDGGLGVAFLSPFDNRRFFLPWTPVRVSPIGVSRFFSARGLAVLQSEVLWIWLPAILLAVAALMVRGQQTKSTHD